MGRLILCRGNLAVHPYYFQMGNWYVYSLEELCYYLYENIYIIRVSDFDHRMISFLQDELDLADAAKELSEKIRSKANLKELVLYIFSLCDYYEDKERQELLDVIIRIENLSPVRKQKIKGDQYLKYKKYTLAQKEYENLLESKAVTGLSEQQYGDLLHNMAVARVHMSLGKESMDLWKRAYQMNHRKESLKQYLAALFLSGQSGLFEEEAEFYGVNQTEREQWIREIKDAQLGVKETEEYSSLLDAVQEKEKGQMNGFYKKTEAMIEKFKQDYRREMETDGFFSCD